MHTYSFPGGVYETISHIAVVPAASLSHALWVEQGSGHHGASAQGATIAIIRA